MTTADQSSNDVKAQLRAYNEKFPPSPDLVTHARHHWSHQYQPRMGSALSASDNDIKEYLARRARNDNCF